MKRLLLATRNDGKVRELRQLLESESVKIATLASRPELGDVEETGKSFEANARIKASYFASASGMWTVAEDSGLVVDALGGEPGVHSARYSGLHADDAGNNRKLVEELRGIEDRSARYVCSIALARPDGTIVTVAQGVCEGTIIDQPRGTDGFGYDPHFVAAGETRTNAELPTDEKNAISHRGQALRTFLPLLRVHLADD